MATEIESQQASPLSTTTISLKVKDFIWSEDEWPNIKHNDFATSEDIPIVSLSNKKNTKEYEEECKKMVEASREWGFFKLVEHGIDEEIVEGMKRKCMELFELPMERKVRGGRGEGLPLGYSASNPDYSRNLPWAEILQLLQCSKMVVEFGKKVFGEFHQPFR